LEELVLGLQPGFFFDALRFLAGFIQNLLSQGLQGVHMGIDQVLAVKETRQEAEPQNQSCKQQIINYIHEGAPLALLWYPSGLGNSFLPAGEAA
jgi:hypothetical protein